MADSHSGEFESYRYDFIFRNGDKETFILKLLKPNLDLVASSKPNKEEWAQLEFEKCPNCPLSKEEHPQCPVANNLGDVIRTFAAFPSHEEVDVHIHSSLREYSKTISIAEGLSSLIGLHMVTSGCPVMDKLRPMVYTHLPFASADETIYRAISMYLMAIYFQRKNKKDVPLDLGELVNIYEEVRKVNVSFTKRLAKVASRDANISALVNLDGFALLTSHSILDDSLNELESLFKSYL